MTKVWIPHEDARHPVNEPPYCWKILSDVFRVVVQTVIILVLALLSAYSLRTGFPGYMLVIFHSGRLWLAWSGISLALGLRTKSAGLSLE